MKAKAVNLNLSYILILIFRELGWAMRAMGMNPTENELLELINEVILPICIIKINLEIQVDRQTDRQTGHGF